MVQAAGVTNLISAGFSDRDDISSGVAAGQQYFGGRQVFVSGYVNSTATGADTVLSTSIAVPIWAVDNQTVGLLSNLSGTNRSLLGLAFGLDPDGVNGNPVPIIWPGPVAWSIARGVCLADAANGGSLAKTIDPDATTDTVNTLAEAQLSRQKIHGKVSAIEFSVTGATLAASGATNYTVFTVWKRDGVGGSPVSLGTLSTALLAFTQWTTLSFTLSAVAGALDLLETDLITVTKTHGSSGAIAPAGNFRVVQKVG